MITESGQLLGRVLGFSFDIETGDLISLVMGAVGVPLLGEGVLSTWEIPVEEIVSSGTDRIIVYEGAEEKLKQLSSGLLEKLGVGGSSWDEREVNGYSANLVPVENQLLSGSESEQQNNLVEEYEEVVEQDDYEDDYEDELEYVEIKGYAGEINNRKKLYMDNDDSDQIRSQNIVNQIDEKNNIDFKQKKQSTTNLASKRPIQNATETLDIEPLNEQNLVQDNKKSEKFEIDDPW